MADVVGRSRLDRRRRPSRRPRQPCSRTTSPRCSPRARPWSAARSPRVPTRARTRPMGLFRTRTEPTTPLEGIDAVFADLDGVVYAGAGSIPHAVESLNRTKAERPVGYITNNASRSDASVARHLAELGLDVAPDGRGHVAAGGDAPARGPRRARIARLRRRRRGHRRPSWRSAGSASRVPPTTIPPRWCRDSRPRSAGASSPRRRSR